MRRFKIVIVLALLACSVGVSAHGQDQGYNNQLQQWRAKRAADLQAPEGWLSVVGLEWLKPGDNTIGTASDDRILLHISGHTHFGVIRVESSSVQLKAPAGGFPFDLKVDSHTANEQEIVVDGPKATKFTYGTLTFFVIRRGDQLALRIKDSQAPARLGFRGLNWYAPDPAYRVEAEWVPLDKPKEVTIQNVVGIPTRGLVPGIARFKILNQEITLEPTIESLDDDSLMFVIRDATSGNTTYAASRFLDTELPDHGLLKAGKILLDFNRLVNPPCAFTPYATCPLPPQSNKLKLALEVGELRYDH